MTRALVVNLGMAPENIASALASSGLDVVDRLAASAARSPADLRRRFRDSGADVLVVASADWSRETAPQRLQLAAAAARPGVFLVLDHRHGQLRRVAPLRAVADAVTGGAWSVAGLVAAERRTRALLRTPAELPRQMARAGRWVVVVWQGSGQADGGAATHLVGVIRGFRAHGLRCAVVTAYPPPARVADAADDLEVVAAAKASHRITGDLQAEANDHALLEAAIRVGSARDTVLVYQRHALLLTAGLDAATRLGLPLVLEWNASEVWADEHWGRPRRNVHTRRFRQLAIARERLVVARASLVAAVSDAARDMAVGCGADPARVLVVPNAVDPDEIPTPDPALRRRSAPMLGWAGSFGPWHGAEMAIRALTLLPEDVHLRLVGDGPRSAACQKLADDLRIRHRVHFDGRVGHRRCLELLAECDILLCPTVPLEGVPFFGSPTKLFEFLALGRPVVASDLEQQAQLIDDGRNGLLFPATDYAALAHQVERLLCMEDRGSALGAAARADALTAHTWPARVQQLLAALS